MKKSIKHLVVSVIVVALAFTVLIGTQLSVVSNAGAAEESTTTTSSRAATSKPSPSTESTTTTTIRSERTVTPERVATPGVYVDQISGFGSAMVQETTGVAAIVGVGPDPSKPAVMVSSLSDFNDLVPGASTSLAAAVEQYFSTGGLTAVIKGASGSSAAAILAALQTPISPIPLEADLLVSADLFTLSGSEWLDVAAAMGQVAATSSAIALIDPPGSTVAQVVAAPTSLAPLTGLGSELRSRSAENAESMMLFASNLLNTSGQTVPVSPAFAGVIAQTDANEGFWNAPNGFANTFSSVRPQFAATRMQSGQLQVAGLDPLMYFPGRGAAVISDRLLAGMGDYLSEKRSLDTISSTITDGINQYVFAANDAATWSAVSASVSAYLESLFVEGALVGTNAASAYNVECGLGTTMTGQDILNGYMILTVEVAIAHPGQFDRISFKQQMQTS